MHCRFIAAFSLFVLGSPGSAFAQDSGWRSFVSISPLFEDADLDSGGGFTVNGALLRAGTSTGFGNGNRVGFTFNYDYVDYSFDDPKAFGGVAPWDVVQRYGFSVPLSFAMGNDWSVGVTPSFDWFRENGANSSDALAWGGTLTALKRFADGNVLGLGVGVFEGIEESRVFPFPIVDWRLGPKWRLVNPLAAGPTGPAGLELDYQFDAGWTMGLGFAYRSVRYRLSESGPVANGIGEISGLPVFLRASWAFEPKVTLHAYAGVVTRGELRVEGPTGNLLRDEEIDPAPLVGLNLTARF